MFVDGIELIIALKHCFKLDRIRILAYSLYSYGFPLLITILSISLSTSDKQYVILSLNNNPPNTALFFSCWFSYDNPFIWTFGIPFVLLILVSSFEESRHRYLFVFFKANTSFFILSISTICKYRKASDPSKRIR